MAFLFLPTIHNSLFNQSKDAVAVINSMQKGSSSNGSSTSSNGNQKPSPILDAFCTSIVKLVILFQMNRYIFYIACAIYWGIDETFGQHLICSINWVPNAPVICRYFRSYIFQVTTPD